jgi:hypothetical protein
MSAQVDAPTRSDWSADDGGMQGAAQPQAPSDTAKESTNPPSTPAN